MSRDLIFALALMGAAGLAGEAQGGRPFNDDFATAPHTSAPFFISASTTEQASSEFNEPILSGHTDGPTIWWRWTAPADGLARVRVRGDRIRAVLAVYRGALLSATRLVASDLDNSGPDNLPEVRFDAVAGTRYAIQVLGARSTSSGNPATFSPWATAPVVISAAMLSGWTPPNDRFENRAVISGATPEIMVSNLGASREDGEPRLPSLGGPPGLPPAEKSVWVEWTAPSSGTWQLHADLQDYGAMVGVYRGTALSNLVRLAVATLEPVNFRAEAGQKYQIQVDGVRFGTDPGDGVCRVRLQPATPPANDNFANAILLLGSSARGEAWSASATREPGEPLGEVDEKSKSVWWRWTPPASGLLRLRQFEGDIEAMSGDSLANLQRVPFEERSGRRNSPYGVHAWHRVTAGIPHYFVGYGTTRVAFDIAMVPGTPNDDFENATPLAGSTLSVEADARFASWQAREPDTDGFGPQTVWFAWTAPAAGTYRLDTEGSADFTRLRIFTGTSLQSLTSAGSPYIIGFSERAVEKHELEATAGVTYHIRVEQSAIAAGAARLNIRPLVRPPNDDFAAASVQSGSAWSSAGTTVDATTQYGDEPLLAPGSHLNTGGTIWWRWTAPATGTYRLTTNGSAFDSVIAIHTGSTLAGLKKVAENGDAGWNSSGSIVFRATARETYSVQAAAQQRQEGELRLSLAPLQPPPNDDFAARIPLAGRETLISGTLSGATAQSGEPSHIAPGTGGRSVWYEWTAPASGEAVFEVSGSNFHPALGLYFGSSLSTLDAASLGGGTSQTARFSSTSYPVSAGTRLNIVIDAGTMNAGDFQLRVFLPGRAPANDQFAARTVLGGSHIRTGGSNLHATRESGEPRHADLSPSHSLWWEWTAPASGLVVADTEGSANRARLAVYTGGSLAALTPVVAKDATAPELFSQVRWEASAGTRYVIALDTFRNERGELALNIAQPAAAAGDRFGSPIIWSGDQQESLVSLREAGAEAGEPAHGGRPAARSIWIEWVPPVTRRALLWFETPATGQVARLAVYRGNTLASLLPIASTTSDERWARLEVDVVAGQSYRIALDAPATAVPTGLARIGVAPPKHSRDSAFLIQPGAGELTANTLGAVSVQDAPSSERVVWWAWQPDAGQRVEWRSSSSVEGLRLIVTTAGTYADAYSPPRGQMMVVPTTGEAVVTFDSQPGETYFLGVATKEPATVSVRLTAATIQPCPPNVNFGERIALAGPSWSVNFTLGTEVMRSGGPDPAIYGLGARGTQWWEWTAPATGVAEVRLTGTLAANDALVVSPSGFRGPTTTLYTSNGGPPVARIFVRAGERWVISTRTGLFRPRPATLALTQPAPGTPPANDLWENPEVLPVSWNSINGDVTFASTQAIEPDHSTGGSQAPFPNPGDFPNNPGRSVWFQWTPQTSGTYHFRLRSSAPLAMAIWSGDRLETLRYRGHLRQNQQMLAVFLHAGVRHHISVAGRPPEEVAGPFTLSLSAAAPNDQLGGAVELTGASGTSAVDSFGATAETGEPGFGFSFEAPRSTLWWRWTAPATRQVWFDTLGSEFDTVLTAFEGDLPDTTRRVAENDNASNRRGVTSSAVSFAAVAGRSYILRIARRDSEAPHALAQLNWFSAPPPDAYARFLSRHPALAGNSAENSDPDGDGIPNLLEMVLRGDPVRAQGANFSLRVPSGGGLAISVPVDRSAVESFAAAGFELFWEVSRDLKTWRRGPAATHLRMENGLSIEQITLGPADPPFARLRAERRGP